MFHSIPLAFGFNELSQQDEENASCKCSKLVSLARGSDCIKDLIFNRVSICKCIGQIELDVAVDWKRAGGERNAFYRVF